jgi:hypothetical protein
MSDPRSHTRPLARSWLVATVAVLVLLVHVVPVAHASGPASGVVAEAVCDVTISPSQSVIDGSRLPAVAGGGTICLAPGNRGNLKLQNLHGAPGSPVIVRNEGGVVQITGTEYEAGINIAASTYLVVSGAGESTDCGVGFERRAQACGITVDGAKKGVKVATSKGDVRELTIDHIAILRIEAPEETRGIAIHPVPGQVVDGITIERNYVSNTGAEAIYIGSEPRDASWDDLGKVDRVEIAYNLVEHIGWDGIKLKVALSASSIHHNVVRNVGNANYERHRSGITVATSVVDVHHNTIKEAVEGIKSGRGVEHATNQFHDNVIADVQLFAILTDDDGASIHHNTVARSEGIGIKSRGNGSRIVENIIADASEPLVHRADATVRANLVTTTDEAGFVDAARGDFTLKPESPARARGSITRVDICAAAAMRVGRPIGFLQGSGVRDVLDSPRCRHDIGASPPA